ncbi:hypothetical protein N7528_007372 [Penicillium herquei]|nr:hypothetical protein N7528_007372 [Penicillium herquei]
MAPMKALICDLGNVVCDWTPPSNLCISPKTLKLIMSSELWFDYERGRLSREECYNLVTERFNLSLEVMETTMAQARQTLQVNQPVLQLLQQIKDTHSGLKIYGMTNTPQGEQEALDHLIKDRLFVFDHIYISGEAGMRKPDISFYNHVIHELGLSGEEAQILFVDDRLENILAAQSVGMRALKFVNEEQMRRELFNVLGDPVARGRKFLQQQAKKMYSLTNEGQVIFDNFAQLLILEITQNQELVDLGVHSRTWNFFIGNPRFTTETFPNDLDTTSLALTVLPVDSRVVNSVLDEMLGYRDDDGIFLTYFDRSRPRVDPTVCVNILRLFCTHGREAQVTPTFNWVLKVLQNRAYLQGTRYYTSPDAFLYFLTGLMAVLRNHEMRHQLQPLLKSRITEQIGAAGDSIALAMRVLSCTAMGIANVRDRETLRQQQLTDGGWPVGSIYRYGSSGLDLGNRGLSTALAIHALGADVPETTAMAFTQISPHRQTISKLFTTFSLFYHTARMHVKTIRASFDSSPALDKI